MSSDSEYLSFLTKANQDPASGTSTGRSSGPGTTREQSHSTSQSKTAFDPSSATTSSSSAVPTPLKDVATTFSYTSETDSPFEVVIFAYSGSNLPGAGEFARSCLKRVSATAEDQDEGQAKVEELSVGEFDPRGQYAEVVRRVRRACYGSDDEAEGAEDNGEVKVYRVEISQTRAEYYILGLSRRRGEEAKLVGVKARAVES